MRAHPSRSSMRSVAVVLVLLGSVAAILLVTAPTASATVYFRGIISVPTTWGGGAETNYVATGPVTIRPSGSLTIMPGTTVKFDPGVHLFVDGRLTADGTSAKANTFTANNTASLFPWGGIQFNASSFGSVSWSTFDRVDRAVTATDSSPGPTSHTILQAGVGFAFVRSSSWVSSNTIMRATNVGVYANTSDVQIAYNSINGTAVGIQIEQPSFPTVSGNTITNVSSGFAMGILVTAGASASIDGNTIRGVRGHRSGEFDGQYLVGHEHDRQRRRRQRRTGRQRRDDERQRRSGRRRGRTLPDQCDERGRERQLCSDGPGWDRRERCGCRRRIRERSDWRRDERHRGLLCLRFSDGPRQCIHDTGRRGRRAGRTRRIRRQFDRGHLLREQRWFVQQLTGQLQSTRYRHRRGRRNRHAVRRQRWGRGGDRRGVRFSQLLLELGHDVARRSGRRRIGPHGRGPRRGRARDHLGTGDERLLTRGHRLRSDEGRSGRGGVDPDVVCGRVLPHRQQDLHDPLHGGQRDPLLDRELRVLRG